MEEIQTRARLVDPDASGFEGRGVAVALSRGELEAVVAAGEYPADLILDVTRVAGDDGADEASRLAVSWAEAEVADILRTAGEDDVVLWFDERDLERAIEEEEVSAHGLRERAAVLTVAVVAAGATTGSALAQAGTSAPRGANSPFLRNVAVPDGSSSAASQAVEAAQGGTTASDATPRGAASPFARNVAVPDGAAGVSSRSVEAAQGAGAESDPAPRGAASPFARNVAVPDGAAGVSSRSVEAAQGAGAESDPAPRGATSPFARNVAVPDGATGASSGGRSSATAGGEAVPFSSTGGGLLSPGEDAAIAAGAAMLITAAGFGLTRSRKQPERPA